MTEPSGPKESGDSSTGEGAWHVVVTSRCERDLGRLPPRVATAIVEFLTVVLPGNPMRMTEPLVGDLAGYRSARRGDYRLIVRLDESARTVVVHRVAHRAHAYRPG